jgi:hypothetical protein
MEVAINDTTFWKVWNTLRDTERFLANLDVSGMTEDESEDTEQLLADVRWRMNNLAPQMEILKENENNCKESLNRTYVYSED